MKLLKFLSCCLILLGIIIGCGTVWLCLENLNSAPVLLQVPEEATAHSEELMEALVGCDYETAGSLMYGTPDLGAEGLPDNQVGAELWKAFQNSLCYEFAGECYASGSGVSRDVSVTALDISKVLSLLAERSPGAVLERARQASDLSEIYDENHEYRQDFILKVLQDTLEEILQEQPGNITSTVTLDMVYREESWWILPSQELIRAVTGGIAG